MVKELADITSKVFIGCVVLLLAIVMAPSLADAQSDPVILKRTAVGTTTIMEFENNSEEHINEIKIWIIGDANFESFKNEYGWQGVKNSAGALVFTTAAPAEPGRIVKFGVQTDVINPIINWKAIDADGQQIAIGTSNEADVTAPPLPVAEEPPEEEPPEETPPSANQTEDNAETEPPVENEPEETGVIFERSILRILPDELRVGNTIRVVGDDLAPNEKLDFYMGGQKIKTFETNTYGRFVGTSNIPKDTSPDRIDFALRDADGNEKTISLRVGQEFERVVTIEIIDFTINEVSEIGPGEVLKITGTASPEVMVTVKISNPSESMVTDEPIQTDTSGNWEFETVISQSAELGKYVATVTDGTETKEATWEITSSRSIHIKPTTLKYVPGDIMTFTGTAVPDEYLELILENPRGIEVFSDTIRVGQDGNVSFSYQSELSSPEGTYALFATQGDNKEVILTGLGVLPEEHIIVQFDKPNYQKFDIARVTIKGPESAPLALLVVNPSDVPVLKDNIVLQPNGLLEYELSLDNFTTGVYSMVVSRANTKTTQMFPVGLQYSVGSGSIDVTTTKSAYNVNDPILVLTKTTSSNVLIKLDLINPEGIVISSKDSFTAKEKASSATFRVPTDAEPGIWRVKVSSGSTFGSIEFEVLGESSTGLAITTRGVENVNTAKIVRFSIFGAHGTSEITITDEIDRQIGDALITPTNSVGETLQSWIVPKDVTPGTYTATVVDSTGTASVEFVIE